MSSGRQRGSVLMLVPAGVLVLFVLGAIAVDFAIAFSAQRRLSGAAAAAANDAAVLSVSDEALYAGAGQLALDPRRAREVAVAALRRQDLAGVHDVTPTVDADGRHVCVSVTARVDYVFAMAIPGGPDGTTVTGRAVATAVRGPAGAGVPARTLC